MSSMMDNDQHYLCHTGDRQPFTISNRLLQLHLSNILYLYKITDPSKNNEKQVTSSFMGQQRSHSEKLVEVGQIM